MIFHGQYILEKKKKNTMKILKIWFITAFRYKFNNITSYISQDDE
jgi:hypothetical protein